MSTLMLKDLETNKELDRQAQAKILGGNNFAGVGGVMSMGSGVDILSPDIIVNVPTVVQLDNDFAANILSAFSQNGVL